MTKLAINLSTDDKSINANPGRESTVSRAAELQQQIESLTTELAAVKADLRSHAATVKNGDKSVYLQGNGTDVVRVTWADSFKALPSKNEQALRDALGHAVVDSLFAESITARLKPKADTVALLEAMTSAGLDPRQWFSVGAVLKPCDNFSAKAEAIANNADNDKADALRELVGTIRHEPKVYINPALKAGR